MIDLTGCVSIPYFKKTVFTGSDGKMRYLLGKAEENEETVLKAWYWEGPYASMYVPEDSRLHSMPRCIWKIPRSRCFFISFPTKGPSLRPKEMITGILLECGQSLSSHLKRK